MSRMSARLDRAFRETTYRAFIPGAAAIDLVIGQASAALDALLTQHDADEWAFITAWNPRSTPLAPAENDARNAALRRAVESGGWRCFEGQGIPDRGGWTPEASFLVLGIPRGCAVDLARRFGQHAIVAGRRGGAAELLYVV